MILSALQLAVTSVIRYHMATVDLCIPEGTHLRPKCHTDYQVQQSISCSPRSTLHATTYGSTLIASTPVWDGMVAVIAIASGYLLVQRKDITTIILLVCHSALPLLVVL